LGILGFVLYLKNYYSSFISFVFLLSLAPTLIYFIKWFLRVLKDESKADYRSTMKLNQISSLCFMFFFGLLAVWRNWPGIADYFTLK
jgi:hypothetical protein